MAATPYELERRAAAAAETEQRLSQLELEQIKQQQRADKHEARIATATTIAIVAALGGGIFGLINFALLVVLLAR